MAHDGAGPLPRAYRSIADGGAMMPSVGGGDFDTVVAWARANPWRVLAHFAPDAAAKLRPDGAGGWRGPCPLHGGTGPNFALNDRGWFCHSQCGGGGDGIDLARRLMGWSDGRAGRVESIRALADLAGVTLEAAPPRTGRTARPAVPRPPMAPPARPDPLEALRADGLTPAEPLTVHTHTLHDGLTLGPMGADYLRARGFDASTAETFGFRSLESAAAWDALEAFLAEHYLPEERAAAGLATVPRMLKAGEGWQVTTGLVIPYHAADGRGCVGWQLRLFTPPTPADRFRKLKGYALPLPFNAGALPDAAGGEVHLVEGELNAYTLHTYGLRAVGLGGAKVWRREWADLMLPAERVVAWYDEDDAGNAAWDAVTRALAEGVGRSWVRSRLRRVVIPKGPDSKDTNDLHRRGELAPIVERAIWRT